MKKILFNTLPMAMVMLASLTACSNDDMANEGKGDAQIDIKLSENAFGSDDDATRYIMSDSYVVDSQQVNIGDGLVADVVITKDPAESNEGFTRASGEVNAAPSGNYTIAAYPSNYVENNGGINPAEPSYTFDGSWDGSKFTLSSGKVEMAAGTYKFTCYNTGVWAKSQNILVHNIYNAANWNTNAEKEVISDKVVQEIKEGQKNPISFTLNHRSSGFRLKISSTSGNISNDVAATITEPTIMTYWCLPTGQAYTGANILTVPDHTETVTLNTVNNSGTTKTAVSDKYIYIASANQTKFNDIKVAFTGGTVNGKSLNGKSFNFASTAILAEGYRYTVNVNVKMAISYDYKVTVVGTNGTPIRVATVVNNVKITNNNSTSVTVEGDENGWALPGASVPTGYLLEKWTTSGGGPTVYDDTYGTFSVKDNNGKTITANTVKIWEKTDGTVMYRARITNGEKIQVGQLTANNNENAKIYFTANGNSSSFSVTVNGSASAAVANGYNYSYDSNSGIYTITFKDITSTNCPTIVCDNAAWYLPYALQCPVKCETYAVMSPSF